MAVSGSGGRRRRRGGGLSVTGVVTAAAATYGVYRLASWAWDAYSSKSADGEERYERRAAGGDGDGNEDQRSRRRQQQQQQRASTVSTDNRRTRRHQDTSYSSRAAVRRARVSRCRAEVAGAMSDFLPTLRRAVAASTDASAETEALKRIRSERRLMHEGGGGDADANGKDEEKGREEEDKLRREERELWETVKVKAVARLVSTAYAHAALFLVLTVQVHLLGGRLLRDEEERGGEEASSLASSLGQRSASSSSQAEMARYRQSHRTVLTRTYDRVFEQGIPSLTAAVERAASDSLQDLDVADEVTAEALDGVVDSIRSAVEERGGRGRGLTRGALVRFVVPEGDVRAREEEPWTDDIGDEDADAQHVLDETWDLLESPVFADAERDCLDETFRQMQSGGWGGIFAHNDNDGPTSLPLAQVVARLRRVTGSFHRQPPASLASPFTVPLAVDAPNVYLPLLEGLSSVLELGHVSFD